MIEIKCKNCGKTFYRSPSKRKSQFCCKECFSTFKRKNGGMLTEEQKRYIEDNYLTRTYREISEKIGVSLGQISRFVHGVLNSQVYNDRLTEEQKDMIDELRMKGGLTLKQIADAVDAGYYQVVNYATKHKIERKNRTFTREEIKYVEENYRSYPCNADRLAYNLGISVSSLKRLATKIGVTRKYTSKKRELKNGRGRSSQQAI